jgi:hypothetical protein
MTEIRIEEATNAQLDYAVAVAQSEEWKAKNLNTDWRNNNFIFSDYHPTTNQAQCGELIDEFKISTHFGNDLWLAKCYEKDAFVPCEKSRLVAACKAYLWSVYPDGMIEVEND